jgi:hypothetical protein
MTGAGGVCQVYVVAALQRVACHSLMCCAATRCVALHRVALRYFLCVATCTVLHRGAPPQRCLAGMGGASEDDFVAKLEATQAVIAQVLQGTPPGTRAHALEGRSMTLRVQHTHAARVMHRTM